MDGWIDSMHGGEHSLGSSISGHYLGEESILPSPTNKHTRDGTQTVKSKKTHNEQKNTSQQQRNKQQNIVNTPFSQSHKQTYATQQTEKDFMQTPNNKQGYVHGKEQKTKLHTKNIIPF